MGFEVYRRLKSANLNFLGSVWGLQALVLASWSLISGWPGGLHSTPRISPASNDALETSRVHDGNLFLG